jgi:hypothetical protein
MSSVKGSTVFLAYFPYVPPPRPKCLCSVLSWLEKLAILWRGGEINSSDPSLHILSATWHTVYCTVREVSWKSLKFRSVVYTMCTVMLESSGGNSKNSVLSLRQVLCSTAPTVSCEAFFSTVCTDTFFQQCALILRRLGREASNDDTCLWISEIHPLCKGLSLNLRKGRLLIPAWNEYALVSKVSDYTKLSIHELNIVKPIN